MFCENRTKRRRKGFKELNGKLKNLERMELNDDEEFLEEESSEEGLESDDWIKRREGGSKNQEIQELEEEDDHHEEGYFPTGILKNGKSGGKSNYSNSNNHQDSSSLRLNLNNSNSNPNPNHPLPFHHATRRSFKFYIGGPRVERALRSSRLIFNSCVLRVGREGIYEVKISADVLSRQSSPFMRPELVVS